MARVKRTAAQAAAMVAGWRGDSVCIARRGCWQVLGVTARAQVRLIGGDGNEVLVSALRLVAHVHDGNSTVQVLPQGAGPGSARETGPRGRAGWDG